MRALILSAGLGERLRPLTLKRAKPAIEFLNMPMLAFPYYWLNTLKLTDVVFNTHYLPDSVRHAAMHVVPPEVRIHFSHEYEILGSGGGIWQARFDLMKEKTFAVANGDGVILDPDPHLLQKMLDHHEREKALATLLVCPLEGVGTRIPGVWIRPDGSVAGFGKTSPASGTQCLHYASYMLFSDEIWPMLPEGGSNILYDVLEPQIRKGTRVTTYRSDELRWFETGNVADYLSATKQCLDMMASQSLLGRCAQDILHDVGPSYQMRSRLDLRQLIADTADIAPTTQIEGFTVIGDRARVESVHLRDSVVLPGATVETQSLIKDSVII